MGQIQTWSQREDGDLTGVTAVVRLEAATFTLDRLELILQLREVQERNQLMSELVA
ncbi:MAG: hypothetical protein M3N53_03630 [Actinomycetota bacterium]|nr:hypothetical protein [Actinomycetota bacterium]